MTKDQLTVLITVIIIVGAGLAFGFSMVFKTQHDEAQLQDHRHIRLFVLQGGQNVTVPAHIGIDSNYWQHNSH
jgi:uncharacterized protein YneR